MPETTNSRQLGVDLITYYHPEFWSVESFDQLQKQVAEDPRPFWDRVFGEVEAVGIGGIEVTFGPGSWQNARKPTDLPIKWPRLPASMVSAS